MSDGYLIVKNNQLLLALTSSLYCILRRKGNRDFVYEGDSSDLASAEHNVL